ncbi:titin isoform X6 [Topomyia yanbarensis]|uniref:titin isoform X6 n=1 Tax=Topomyia yanbarensis TaxID=2498891 RepID=UPI00273AEC54|nr:titin isoform X6 [Topomyia yanbarensis]
MEADVLNALNTQTAYLPGGRDRDAHPLIVIPVPFYDSLPWMKGFLETTVKYILSTLSSETIAAGFTVILDAQKCSWRSARQYIRHAQSLLEPNLDSFLVIRPDAFWEKNRVENCTRQHRQGEPTVISKSRLIKYFELSELPEELGGTGSYNHDQWIQNRLRIEEFRKSYDKAIGDLENLHRLLLDNRTVRASESEAALKSCRQLNQDVQKFLAFIMDGGNKLIAHIGDLQSTKPFISQDLLDSRESIQQMLNTVERKQSTLNMALHELERNVEELRELATLEEGVVYVTNWILTTAETMLNAQLKVGYDVATAEKLRLEHEILELQCWKSYGFYAELIYKIDNFPKMKESVAYKDLLSQREWMDFVCRSFAQRLERRRNVLITSVRFYRLVAEYFDRTSEVFQSLIMGDKVEDFDLANSKLQKLKDSQHTLDSVEKEIIKEGEKLSDILSMPVKDAVGREVNVDYSEDIANVRDILDATISRSRIFVESVELQKLTLDQITHIYKYEMDAETALQWMNDLYKVMIRSHTHVGTNVYEIQTQKDEHQTFQETGKGTYNYGCQLLNASLALRQSCKLETDRNIEMTKHMQETWKQFQAVSQEQLTRLRVSAVFHRSVEEHCTKLYELKDNVLRIGEIEETNRRKVRLRKCLGSRERLLVEVGRMVRLGRLLKTRLKEPFLLDDRVETMATPENVLAESDNIMACEAISARLAEVSRIAESLDSVLRDVQGGFDEVDEEVIGVSGQGDQSSGSDKKLDGSNHSDDWSCSMKSTDESFVTASDCTCTPQSRSSSYHTASECRASPWWGGESTERSSLDNDSSEDADPEAMPSIKLLSGVVITASTANLSFDESEHSFLTPTSSSDQADSDDPQVVNSRQQLSPVISSGSSSALNSINRRENLALALTPEELEQIENDIRNNNVVAESTPKVAAKHQHSSPTSSEDSGNVADPYLQKARAAQCVDRTLTELSARQLAIGDEWERWNAQQQAEKILNDIMAANMETLAEATKLEEQLYPIFNTASDNPADLSAFIGSKLNQIQADIRAAENELTKRFETIDQLASTGAESGEKVVQVKNSLNSIKTKLHTIAADFRELASVVEHFLRSVSTCRDNIKDYFAHKQTVTGPESVESITNSYEQFKQNTMEYFRNLLQQSEQIIERIKAQEPPGAKEQDTDKIITLLENLRTYFETQTESENSELRKQHAVIAFDKSLNEVRTEIGAKVETLNHGRGNYGANADGARCNLVVIEKFESELQELSSKIDNFVTASQSLSSQYPETSPYVHSEATKIRNEWADLLNKTQEYRQLTTVAIDYFELISVVENNYRDLNADLINANNKLSILNNPDLANDLVQQIDNIIKAYESQQLDTLKQISTLSSQLYGHDSTIGLYNDNLKLFQTFYKIKSEINDRAKELTEQQQQQETQQNEITTVKTTTLSSLPKQPSIEIQTIDEAQYLKEPQPPLVIQTVEESVHEQIHEIITATEPAASLTIPQPLSDVTVQEGQRVQLQCVIFGHPPPAIEWFKDGISIQNNPDYKTSFENGLCALTIDETVTADSAEFLCRAINEAGIADTAGRLTVTELAPVPQPQGLPPVFVQKLNNSSAVEGQPFQYSCTVTGNPLPVVHWYKNDTCIDTSPDYKISFDPASGVTVLRFEQVFLEDQARYTCRASNECGADETGAELAVEPLEPTEYPSFAVPLSNVMARVGQKIKLEAEVSGTPPPEVMWSHDGKHFTNREVKFFYENGRAQLVIDEAFLKDAGVYTLTAKNIAGEKSCSCNVVVKGRLPHETSDSELASDMEPVKPSVQLQLKDVAVFEGKPVRLDCVIIGQPEPEVIWYHAERPVKESTDFQLLFQGDRCSLVIREAFQEDGGEYRVVAINSAGEASSKCNLIVTPLNIAEPAVRQPAERVLPVLGAPPKFERLLSDILATDGEKCQFECAVSGDPRPSIRWFVNNREIEENPRVRSVYREDGVVKLIIEQVFPEDKGVYTVKAFNPSGEAKCFSNLIVKSVNAPEFETVPAFLSDSVVCPTFKELFADRTVKLHDSTKFECIVVGKPQPKIRWFFNDRPVQGHDFLVSTSGDRQVLAIPEVVPELAGKITCLAENEAGHAQCVAFIKLADVFGAVPFQPQTMAESMLQVDNTGSSTVTLQKQVTTSTSSYSSSTLVENGVSQSEVHAQSAHLDRSFKKVGDKPPEVSESKQFSQFHQSNDLPPSIQQESSIINIANNNTSEMHETIIANSGQISTGKPARRSSAPRFVSPFNGKIVDQGADVVFEGIIDGYPTPEVSVTKNDAQLQPDGERISLSYSLNKIVLELKNVSTNDAGRYTATASNAAGATSTTADLVVKKSIFPPVFGRRLQAQSVNRGDRVILSAEVTGTPEPTVYWFKDNQPVQDALLPGSYALQQVGPCFKLIFDQIDLADAGKYMVLAKNGGGEAQSIADIAVLDAEPVPQLPQQQQSQKRVSFVDVQQPPPDEPRESIPGESGFTAHQEFSAESKLQGPSTESTIVTETRRTTEATMRMEHKISFPDLPVTFSQRTQTPTIPQVSEGTMVQTDLQTSATNTDRVATQIRATQTPIPLQMQPPPQLCKTEATQTTPQVEPKPVEELKTETKRSAFQFFEKITSNGTSESPVAPPAPIPKPKSFKPLKTPVAIDQTHQLVGPERLIYQAYSPGQDINSYQPPATQTSFGPSFEQSSTSETTTSSSYQTTKKVEFLQPRAVTIPTPPIYHQEPHPSISETPLIPKHDPTPSLRIPKIVAQEVPIIRPQATTTPHPERARSSSPRPSAEAIAMERLWTAPKTSGFVTLPRTKSSTTSSTASTTARKQSLEDSKRSTPKSEFQPVQNNFCSQQQQQQQLNQQQQMYSSFSSTHQFQQSSMSQQQYSQSMQYQPFKPSEPAPIQAPQPTFAPAPAPTFVPAPQPVPIPKTFVPAPAPVQVFVPKPQPAQPPKTFTPAPASQPFKPTPQQFAPAPAPVAPKFKPAPAPEPPVHHSLASAPSNVTFISGPSYNQTPQPFKPLPPPSITPSQQHYSSTPLDFQPIQTAAFDPSPQTFAPTPAPQTFTPAPEPYAPAPIPQSYAPALEPFPPTAIPHYQPEPQPPQFTDFAQEQQYYEQQEEIYKKKSVKETKQLFEQSLKQQDTYDLKAPRMIQQMAYSPAKAPLTLPSDFGYTPAEIGLEPGPQPTIGYAPKLSSNERKSSYYREKIEQSLFESMDKVPERVPAGGVKIIPPSPRKKPPAGQSDTAGIAPGSFEQPSEAAKSTPTVGGAKSPFTATESEYESDMDVSRKMNGVSGYLADTEEVQKTVSFSEQKFESYSTSSSTKIESGGLVIGSSEVHDEQKAVESKVEDASVAAASTVTNDVSAEDQQPPQQQQQQSEQKVVTEETIKESRTVEEGIKNFLTNNDLPEDLQPVKVLPTEEPLPTLKKVPVPAAVQPEPQPEPVPEPAAPEPTPAVEPTPIFTPSQAPQQNGYPSASDYESDFEKKATTPVWKPTPTGPADLAYKPVHPVFNPPKPHETGPAAAPPSVFDPIDKIKQAPVLSETPKIEKPTPISYSQSQSTQQSFQQQNSSSFKSYQQQSYQQQSYQQQSYQSFPSVEPKPALYYTSVTGEPVHNTIATETSNTLHMKEMTESSNRVVNMSQTQRVINLEPAPQYANQPQKQDHQPITITQRPGRFTPGEFRDSDHEFDGTRIRPMWTPNPSDSDEPHYRSVRPNFKQSRSASVPRSSAERIQTPMEFDVGPVLMPSKIDLSSLVQPIQSQQTQQQQSSESVQVLQTQTLNRQSSFSAKRLATSHVSNLRDDMAVKAHRVAPINYIQKATNQAESMSQSFKTKAYHFSNEVMTDMRKTPIKPILKNAYGYQVPVEPAAAAAAAVPTPAPPASNAQAYREESRVSQYGTKHVDPDTGIIYFKYDFGYEFGIIFPGEGHRIAVGGGSSKKQQPLATGSSNQEQKPKHPLYLSPAPFGSHGAHSLEVPVLHERTKDYYRNCASPTAPFRRSASVPATDLQDSRYQQRYSYPTGAGTGTGSGRSTPRVESFRTSSSCCTTPDQSAQGYNRSTTSTPRHPQDPAIATKQPLFVAPLKDIAVVSGQPARFECIVACDATPSIRWAKNNVPIDESSQTHYPEYRNGVCRLSLPVAYEGDAGKYCCVAENHLGQTQTGADLTVISSNWRAASAATDY